MPSAIRSVLIVGAAISLVAGMPAIAGSADDVKQEAGEALDAMKDFTVEQKDKAMAQGREMLDSVDRQIEKLDRKISDTAQDVSAETREDWRRQKARLIEMREEAADRLDRLGESTSEAWGDIKDGFAEAFGTLSDAVSDAVDEAGS